MQKDFENQITSCTRVGPDKNRSACLNAATQFLGPIDIPVSELKNGWVRMEGDFTIESQEYNVWNYTQWILQFYKGEEIIKSNSIRLQRLIPFGNEKKHLFFDVKIPVRRNYTRSIPPQHISNRSSED